jgi:elongation factor Ts
MAVDSAKVKELREKTGLPMMDCKKALEKTDGDIEKAFDELRKSGLKAQEKLAGRTATEGKIGSHISPDGKTGILVALRCETESVGKNAEFQKLVSDVVQGILKERPRDAGALAAMKLPGGETVAAALTELINRIRENITVGRFARFEADAVTSYVHFDQKKAAMVSFTGGAVSNAKVAELGKEICMHVVFSSQRAETTPRSLSREGLDPALVEKEREILLAAARNDPKNAKKPEEILQKIIQGQVDKFIASQVLLEQPYIRDEKITVAEHIKRSGTGVAIKDYVYVATDIA